MRQIVAILLALILCAGSTEAGTYPAVRSGLMLGFGLGGASLGFTEGGNREGSGTANLRAGYALRPTLILGLELAAWRKTFPVSNYDFQTQQLFSADETETFSSSTVALSYFPPQSGLFVRAGLGLAASRLSIDTQGFTVSRNGTGLALLGALGWEWRLTRKFALAPQVEFTYLNLDYPGHVDLIGGGLGLNWYW